MLEDGRLSVPLGGAFQVYEDETALLELDDIRDESVAALFRDAESAIPGFGPTTSAIWVRFDLINAAASRSLWLLELARSDIDSVTLYRPVGSAAGDSYEAVHTGAAAPFTSRDVPDNYFVFRLSPSPNVAQRYYMRLQGSSTVDLPLTIWDSDALQESRGRDSLIWGMAYGALIAMAVLFFLIFLRLRRTTFLILAGYGLAVFVLSATLHGDLARYVWPEHGGMSAVSLRLATAASVLALLFFTSAFLDTKSHAPRAHLLLRLLAAGFLVLLPLQFLDSPPAVAAHLLLYLASVVSIITLAVNLWIRRVPSANWFTAAVSIPLLAGIVIILQQLGLIESELITAVVPTIGSLLLLLMLGVALADQVRYQEDESRQSKLELERQRTRFQTILDDQSEAVIRVLPDGRLTYVNRAYGIYVGRHPDDLVGTPAATVLDTDLLQEVIRMIENVTPANPIVALDTRVTDSSGQERWQHWTLHAIFDAAGKLQEYQGTGRDFTEERTANQRLRAERLRFEQILNSLPEIIIHCSGDGVVAFANQAAADFCGRERDAIAGADVETIVGEVLAAACRQQTNAQDADTTIELNEIAVMDARGRERWLNAVVQGPRSSEDQWAEVQLTAWDVTIQREARQMLVQYQGQLEKLVETRTNELMEANNNLLLNREVTDSLQQTTMALNRALDLPVVLYLILSQVRRVSRHDGAGIWLIDGEDLVLSEGIDMSTYFLGRRISLDSETEAVASVVREGRAIVIEDCATDSRWVKWADGSDIGSWIGIPLMIGDETIGAMTIDRSMPNSYTNKDIALLRPFADQATIAIFNARLLSQARMDAAVEERERLARDLHDAVTQTLFSASLLAEAIPLQYQLDPAGSLVSLQKLQQLTRGALGEMRTLLLELRPTTLIHSNLGTLLGYLGDAATARSRLPVTVTVIGPDLVLPADVQIAFYRIAQEALNNITKHAAPSMIDVQLTNSDALVELVIRDDGRGFTPQHAPRGQLGLTIMSERANAIGAEFHIESSQGLGTTIWLVWQKSDLRTSMLLN